MGIYLDYAATTPVDERVLKEIYDWQLVNFGNPSSPHRHGQVSKIKIEDVRDKISSFLNCQSKEIVFTSGGTESNNMAIIGAALSKEFFGNHIIVSGVEHPSVLSSVDYLKKKGFEVSYINPDKDGFLSLAKLKQEITDKTVVISTMYVNNETGIISPVKEIADLCKDREILFHSDAIQAFGKFQIDLSKLGVDLLSFSAHKIYGPKGIGGLFVRDGVALEALSYGGGQEANKRPGTENLLGIIGLGSATEMINLENEFDQIKGIQKHFENLILQQIDNCIVNGINAERSPYISNISFPGIDNQSLLLNLDLNGLSVSVGSACSSGSIKQSHVLQAMGLNDDIISSAVRFSFGRGIEKQEIGNAVTIVKETIGKLRK